MRKSIALKIFSISLLLLVLMSLVTGISAYHLDAVSDESQELAHYYIPIEQRVQGAARHSTAEALHFERLLNLLREGAPTARASAERASMEARSARVEKDIAEALVLVKKGQNDRSLSIDQAAFLTLEKELPDIVTAHAAMRDTLQAYLAADIAGKGNGATLLDLEERLAEQRTAIHKESSEVSSILEALTKDSAEHALQLEHKAAMLTWGTTALAIFLGLIIAGFITRELVRPVRDLLAGTRAVQAGDLNVEITVRTADELKQLADSFNHMVVGLKQKEAIRATFGRYVDPRIVKNLIEDPHFAQVGERRQMTIFFSDIEGFTSLCERITPDAAVRFLNSYFNVMSEPILDKQGIIDKYIGDAIMAFFGPPFTDAADHARLACEAAIEQLVRMQKFRATVPELIGLGQAALRVNVRMGLATGEVTVGNVGSDKLKGYTVIGDTVNLAARLETAGKQYGVNLIIAESTWAEVRDVIETRELDQIRVVGKSEPVRIFEVLGKKGEVPEMLKQLRDTFAAALKHYRAGRIDEACILWEECARILPTDRPTQLFLERCGLLMQKELPAGWSGVWTLTSK